jgi:hypothetical protein
MKQSIMLLTCLVLIPLFGFRSDVAPDQEGSPTIPIQLEDHALKADADRGDGAKTASLAAVSPYEIKQYIEEHQKDEYVSLAEFWSRLGIEAEEWTKYGTCEAAIFALSLGRGEGTTVMLRLYDPSGWSMGGTRYLFFKPSATARETDWRFLGYVDFEDQRYEIPEHSVITSGADHWLVLNILSGRGSGYGLHHDQWYEIDDNGVRLVLSYPSDKFLAWRNPIPVLEASSRIIGATTESDRTTVVIQFTAAYVLYVGAHSNEKIDLWARTQSAVFVRSSRQEPFRLDAHQSQLSNKEVEAVYAGEGPSNKEILRYNFDELEEIATGPNERSKEWLRSYLSECRDTPEKERLIRALTH